MLETLQGTIEILPVSRLSRVVLSLPLAVICKNRKCRFRHPSELQMDKKNFRIAVIENVSEKCPSCGKHSLYNKDDYFFTN
jgi:hypothetical protein